jgi:hypothetical protein
MKVNNLKIGIGIVAVLAQVSCSENPTAVDSPDITVRMAKPAPPPPASGITVISLGSLPYSRSYGPGSPIGMALNNGPTRATTRVAGYTAYGTTREYPFTWTAQSGMIPLSVVDEGYSWPYGVSDNGVIVGEFSNGNGNRAFIVSAGQPMTYLPVPAGSTYSAATGITANGACISGAVRIAGIFNAVVWRNGVMEIVDVGWATGVSNDCLVVAGNGQAGAVVWRNTSGAWTVETLSAQGSAETTDVSPSGQYVAGRRVSGGISTALVWHYSSGTWTATDMPGATMYAFGVNNSGRAVGHGASGEPMVWTRDSKGVYSAQMLPPLERSNNGWPAAINELGQISGRSGNKPVLWTLPN